MNKTHFPELLNTVRNSRCDVALTGLDEESADYLYKLKTNYPGSAIKINHRLSKEISSRFIKILKLD